MFVFILKHMFLTIAVGLVVTTGAHTQSSKLPNLKSKRVFQEIERLVKRHYPKALFHQKDEGISFELNTRSFMIHVPLKTGEWQEARKTRGPKMGGVMGSVELRKGRYEGAALLPQTFDHCYYLEMVSVAYSQKCDRHLYSHLSIPKLDRNDAFIMEFYTFMNSRKTTQGLCE